MTRVTIQTNNDWTKRKIASAINTEAELLKRVISRTRNKIQDFENQYGKLNKETFYGKIDDMELLEWEGEIEVLERLEEKLKSLEGITFEYK